MGYVAHAGVGCVSSVAGGGQCGQGAASAVFGKYTTVQIGASLGVQSGEFNGYQFAATVVAGGVGSVIAGGKFENGAQTAAFGYLFNFLSHATFDRKSGVLDVQDGDKQASGLFFSGTGTDDQITPGKYAILDRGGKDGFRLEAIDSAFGDDMNQNGQSLLRLHGPGRSIGCVTACDGTNWGAVRNLIQNTAPSEIMVNTYKTVSVGGYLLFRVWTGTETVKYYGNLTVK